MKGWFPFVAVGLVLGGVAFGVRSLAWEVKKRAHIGSFEPHHHTALEHVHEHAHVTHNRRQGADIAVGEWDHLTAQHDHSHNHPALDHSHLPHQDAEHEHLGEAHIHDHQHPTVS